MTFELNGCGDIQYPVRKILCLEFLKIVYNYWNLTKKASISFKKYANLCQIKKNKTMLSANSVADIFDVSINVLVKITSNPLCSVI
jgi:hypothetical protein